MNDLGSTQIIRPMQEYDLDVTEVLARVYEALTEKGYNPINQIVGYIMSGDPTYITSHKGARSLIMKVERDEIIEELMKTYVEAKLSRYCVDDEESVLWDRLFLGNEKRRPAARRENPAQGHTRDGTLSGHTDRISIYENTGTRLRLEDRRRRDDRCPRHDGTAV